MNENVEKLIFTRYKFFSSIEFHPFHNYFYSIQFYLFIHFLLRQNSFFEFKHPSKLFHSNQNVVLSLLYTTKGKKNTHTNSHRLCTCVYNFFLNTINFNKFKLFFAFWMVWNFVWKHRINEFLIRNSMHNYEKKTKSESKCKSSVE